MKVVLDTWIRLSDATIGTDGRIVLPAPPALPGVYRFRLLGRTPSVYIGETDQLPRRFAQYRNPGPSQRTNIRLNDRIRQHLAAGEHIAIEVVTAARVEVGAARETLDLARKSHRMLAEEAALEEARMGAMGTVENFGG